MLLVLSVPDGEAAPSQEWAFRAAFGTDPPASSAVRTNDLRSLDAWESCPGFFFEFGRMRDLDKPVWYLPQWWGSVPAPLFRLEQYLTFMMGPQGLMVPPAALYAMSQNTVAMAGSPNVTLAQDFPGQVERLLLLCTSARMAHIGLFPVVEEDILDGTLAANHKALVMTGLERLDPRVVAALEAWIRGPALTLAMPARVCHTRRRDDEPSIGFRRRTARGARRASGSCGYCGRRAPAGAAADYPRCRAEALLAVG